MSKEIQFYFDNLDKAFASCLKFIQYGLVCHFLHPTYPQHYSVAPHPSAPYVMAGHMSAFTNFILSYL